MISNNIYLLQVMLTWGLFYGFYLIFLGKETFFKVNRFYLLGALIIGLVLPFAQAILQQAVVGMQVVQLPTITITNQEANLPIMEGSKESFNIKYWLSVVYWIGFGVMALRFVRDLIGIVWLVHSNTKEEMDGLTIIHIERDMAPFSFFRNLFVFDKDRFSEEEWNQILLHEKTHIDQLHSLDILFTEVLKIIFWWNPLTYLYQRTLREVHEYEADYAVEKKENVKQYGLLLMKQSLSGNQVAVANSFINSQLKKRIIMMTKKRSNSLAIIRYVWSLPLLLMLFFISFGNEVLAQKGIPKIIEESVDTTFIVDPNTYEESLVFEKSTIYENKNLDQIAVLEGCESIKDQRAQRNCSDKKLLTKLYENVQYPIEARLAQMEGMVIIKITIEGQDSRYEILRDPGFGMGVEVLRALDAANFEWNPAKFNGETVDVQFILPVKFILEGDDKADEATEGEPVFSDVKVKYTGDNLRVDFKYTVEGDKHIEMTAYDLVGHFLTSDKGAADYFEVNQIGTKSDFIILVLEDDHGNKVARKAARID